MIVVALASSAPRKIPGKASTLLIWFGKSERPVATTAARPAACSGRISGSGFASANTSGSSVHPVEVGRLDDPGAADADEHVGAGEQLADRSLAAIRVGVLGKPLLGGVQVVPPLPDRTPPVGADHLGHAGLEQDLSAGHPGCADTGDDDSQFAHLLVDERQRVLQGSEHDDCGAVLVVVEHGDVELGLEALLDLEAHRCRDVLQVDPTEARGEPHDRLDDLVGPSTSMQTGNASTPAKFLKSSALPSMTGIAACGPMSPRPSTAVPSLTIATVFLRMVSSWLASTSRLIAMHTRATPGV